MKMEKVRKFYDVRKDSLEEKTIKKVRQQVRKAKPKK